MLKIMNKLLVACCFIFAHHIVSAKSMVQFYGNTKYSGNYDYNDLKRVMLSDSSHESRAGYKGVRSMGKHVNLKVYEDGQLIIDKQRPRQSIHVIAKKDDPLGVENLSVCQFYGNYMLDMDNDDEENLKINLENMYKWRVLREPHQLRSTRYKIYFNSRAVRILNKRIKKEVDPDRKELLIKVRKHFKDKVALLYQKHDELMAMDLEWKPRRWIWANITSNNVFCYKGESFNPEEWYEVKKEIQRILEQIQAVEQQMMSTAN